MDVVTMIEPSAGAVAIPHIIRKANQKSVTGISDEIRAVQAHPGSSEQAGKLRLLHRAFPVLGVSFSSGY